MIERRTINLQDETKNDKKSFNHYIENIFPNYKLKPFLFGNIIDGK
jgi:hypothetical protein